MTKNRERVGILSKNSQRGVKKTMKKSYTTPKLTIHGTVDEITQAFGSSQTNDTIYFGNSIFGTHNGSQDGTIVPYNP